MWCVGYVFCLWIQGSIFWAILGSSVFSGVCVCVCVCVVHIMCIVLDVQCCEVREVRHTQWHGGKEGKAEKISIWIILFVVISCNIFILLPVLFTFCQVWYSHNHCFHFVFHSLCICCTGVTVSCGSTGETSLNHTLYKTFLYKCEIFIFRWHIRREELQYM